MILQAVFSGLKSNGTIRKDMESTYFIFRISFIGAIKTSNICHIMSVFVYRNVLHYRLNVWIILYIRQVGGIIYVPESDL